VRILYFAQFFEPEPMIKGAGFVKALMARGHEVEVVTGFPNYPLGRLYEGYRVSLHRVETISGVTVHRVPLYPSHGRSSVGRILNYFSYVVSAALYGIFKARPFDVIYSYPPPTVALAAALVGWIRRRPFVMDVQDLWPESVVKSGMAGTGGMERALSAMCSFLYKRSGRIIAQSRGMAAKIAERGASAGKIDVIFNWADEETACALDTCDLSSYRLEGKFNIVYGGNLGRLQGLETLVRAAQLAAKCVPNLHLLLLGNGTETVALKALVEQLGANNIMIRPGVPRDQVGDIFAAADVLALHLLNDPLFEITIPQKTQFYLAMGKPVLIGVKGEAAQFVTRAAAGVAVEPGDVAAMAKAMVRLAQLPRAELAAMGARGREAYLRQFSFAAAIDATENTLLRATGESSTPKAPLVQADAR
jgi:glycosyltransferase involved in cell wall biosynthesis